MSLNVNIPLSGQLTSTDDLQLRENTKGTTMLYFKLAVKESDKANGREKTHFLSCVAHGKKAENLMYSVRNGLITTRTRLSVSVGIDTYYKKMIDPATNKTVEVQQTSYTVWELSVSAQFAPIADVSSPGFQQLMNQMPQQGQGNYQHQQSGYQDQPQQGQGGYQNQQGYAPQQGQGGYQNQQAQGQYSQGQNPQQSQGGYQNQPQQGYAPQQGQGGYQNQPQQAQGGYQPQDQTQAPQQGQGGYRNQPQQAQGGYQPQDQTQAPQQGQGGYQNQPQAQDSQHEQAPQQGQGGYQNQPQVEQKPQTEQGKSMRDEPLPDGEDF